MTRLDAVTLQSATLRNVCMPSFAELKQNGHETIRSNPPIRCRARLAAGGLADTLFYYSLGENKWNCHLKYSGIIYQMIAMGILYILKTVMDGVKLLGVTAKIEQIKHVIYLMMHGKLL